MTEVEKIQEATGAPPYSFPNPTAGQPFNQQTQPPPQQLLTVQAQPPPPQTGVQYYTQPYPAVSGTGRYSEVETFTIHTLTIPPLTPLQPQVVLAQPQMPIVATQQTFTTPTDTKLPKYAFVTSVVVTIIFTVLFWLPGFLCLVPATVLSIVVRNTHTDTHRHDTHTHRHTHTHTHTLYTQGTDTHTHTHTSPNPFPQALSKKESNKLKEAKRFSIISFILVLIFAVSYPILVTTVILATVFGYICNYQYGGYSYYSYYYYYRPSYCAR